MVCNIGRQINEINSDVESFNYIAIVNLSVCMCVGWGGGDLTLSINAFGNPNSLLSYQKYTCLGSIPKL